jgi:hypothetical protein
MSAATIAVTHATPSRSLTDIGSQLRVTFYRFLEKLPERHKDIDPDVLKRVPVPI